MRVTKTNKSLNEEIYSLDNLIIDFQCKKYYTNELIEKLSLDSNVTSWTTNKFNKYHYNYSISCQEDSSYYIGVQANWKNDNDIIDIRIDFNPNKVGYQLKLREYLIWLIENCPIKKIKRFDLAIDIPISRDKTYLVKDKRTYSEYSNSSSDKTQYLGQRSSNGRVKLYNKQIESNLDIPLTRLEITVDYESRHEIEKIFPKVLLLENYQTQIDITGTDKVLLIACMQDLQLLKELSRDKRKKIEGLLESTSQSVKFDKNKYNNIITLIEEYASLRKKPNEIKNDKEQYTITVKN